MNKKEIEKIIVTAAEETHTKLAAAIQKTGRETRLFGRDAILDSLALVALIAAVETGLREHCEQDILLVNEDAMSRRHSPFRSVGALCDYIQEMLG